MITSKPRTAGEYRIWWKENTDVPYGYCWCGCGRKTSIAPTTDSNRASFKGEPRKHIQGHGRSPKLTENEELAICHEYEAGSPPANVARSYRIGQKRFAEILQKHGIQKRPNPNASKLNDRQRDEICRLYAEGMDGPTLARRFNTRPGAIYYTLRQRGIARKPVGNTATYPCDETFFDSIDTEQKAYWLGFIAADGCMIEKVAVLQIALAAKDAAHLELFKRHIGSEKPLYHRTTEAFDKSYPGVTLAIGSIKMKAGLLKHGIHPRKTFTLKWPDFLNDELLVHYCRGYFDGDGSFSAKLGRPHSYRASFLGNESFLEGCREFLVNGCRASKIGINENRRNGRVRSLSWGGRLNVQKVARFLYSDATVYLPRKHAKVAHLL